MYQELKTENKIYKVMAVVFAIVAVLATALALHEQAGKLEAKDQAYHYAEQAKEYLKELTKKK